ncbi:helix-turn-helix domain-containing protein [Pontiella sulfatireligans]|nr:AraC family transcriptional regulator [Pontiella sulfatireligans]
MKSMDDIFSWPTLELAQLAAVWPEAIGRKSCGDTLRSNINGGYVSFNYLHRGTLRHQLGRNPESLIKAGSAFAILPGQNYSYIAHEADKNNPLMLWIRLAGPGAKQLVQTMGMEPRTQRIQIRQPAQLMTLWKKLFTLQEKHCGAVSDAAAIALLYQMIPLCSPDSNHTGMDEAPGSLAQRIRNFMHDELERGYNVSQIAQFFKLSRSSLFLHFKREFNQSPIAILKQARLSKARHLLAETDLPTEAIARACGYTSTNHFFHQFKSELGTTPLGYKEHPEELNPNHPE